VTGQRRSDLVRNGDAQPTRRRTRHSD
jgi:hypothetical protein